MLLCWFGVLIPSLQFYFNIIQLFFLPRCAYATGTDFLRSEEHFLSFGCFGCYICSSNRLMCASFGAKNARRCYALFCFSHFYIQQITSSTSACGSPTCAFRTLHTVTAVLLLLYMRHSCAPQHEILIRTHAAFATTDQISMFAWIMFGVQS